jgi:rhomboid protease GluP
MLCPYCRSEVAVAPLGRCPVCGGEIASADDATSTRRPDDLPPPARPDAEHSLPRATDVYSRPLLHPDDRAIVEFYRQLFAATPRAWVTPAIIAANVAVFAVMAWSTGALLGGPGVGDLLDWGANHAPLTVQQQQWWRLVTSMFVHLGLLHLGLNMWALWNLGRFAERLSGNVGMIVLYLVSGVCGSLASAYWNPHAVSAGASGAVFGVFGAMMGFLLMQRKSVPRRLLRALRSNGLQFLIYNVILGLSIPAIDMAAHLGGLVGGFLCGAVLSQPLSQVTRTRRTLRNALALAMGATVVLAVVLAVPYRVSPLQAALAAFQETEPAALGRLQDAARQVEQGELSDAQFADILEQEVLPPWRQVTEQFSQLGRRREERTQRVAQLRQYLESRQAAWETLLRALRTQDPRLIQEYQEQKNAADRLARQLSRESAP